MISGMSPEDRIHQHVASTIKTWRKERDMSQAALAERVGMHQTAIAKIENNERRVDFATVMQIAEVLNIPWQELYYEKPNQLEEVRNAVDAYLRSAYVWSRAFYNSFSTMVALRESTSSTLDAFGEDETFSANTFSLEELGEVMKAITEVSVNAYESTPTPEDMKASLERNKVNYDRIKDFRDKLDQEIQNANS